VHRSGFGKQRLMRRHRGCRLRDHFRWNTDGARDNSQQRHRFGKAFDPAKAAAGWPRHTTLAQIERVVPWRCKGHAPLDSVVASHDFEPLNLVWARHDGFRKAETDGKTLQIGRCCDHHGVSRSVIGQRDGGLFGNRAFTIEAFTVAPAFVRDLPKRLWDFANCLQGAHHDSRVSFSMQTGTPFATGTKLPLA
jgi:hypothetical protein